MTDATLLTDRGRPALRLERSLPDPPEVVWRALTVRASGCLAATGILKAVPPKSASSTGATESSRGFRSPTGSATTAVMRALDEKQLLGRRS